MSTPRSISLLASIGLSLTMLVPSLTVVPLRAASLADELGQDGRSSKKEKKEGRNHAEDRQDWWRRRMGGELGPDFMARVMQEAERQRLLYPERFLEGGVPPNALPEGIPLPAAVSGTTWTSLGPTSSQKIQNGTTRFEVNSGRLRTILPDPGSIDTLYLLTAGGGLWKTTNLSSTPPTWSALSDQIGSTAGGGLAFGRTTSVLYMGLGDAFDDNVGGFVTKSENSGTLWSSPVQLPGATRVLDLKVDTSQGATHDDDIVLVGTNVGLFRSTNGGVAYGLVAGGLAGKKVWSLVKTSQGWLAAAQTNGVSPRIGSLWLSGNQGETWAPVSTMIPNSTTNIGGTNYNIVPGRITLGVGVPGDSTVYAFTAYSVNGTTGGGPGYASDYGQYDLFYSINGGNNWTACGLTVPSTGGGLAPTNPNTDQGDMDIMMGQAFYNHMLLVDPANNNTVYLGGQLSTAKSTNAKAAAQGSTWTLLSNWLPRGTFAGMDYAHADFHCAAMRSDGALLFGNDGGLALSTDGGATIDHSKNVGITSHLVYALASGPICDPHTALIGLQDNGTHNRGSNRAPVQPTSGTVWDQTKGGDGFGVAWSQAGNTTTMASYVFNDIERSTSNPPDDQSKWSAFVNGLPGTPGNDAEYYFVTPLVTPSAAADPTGRTFFTYSGPVDSTEPGLASNKIFKSNSTGWTTIANAEPSSVITPGLTAGRFVREVSHGVGVHPTDINRIAAAGDAGVVLITTNGGTSWTEVALGNNGAGLVPGWHGSNANVEWMPDGSVWVCSESTVVGAARVVKSNSLRTSWTRADGGPAPNENRLPDLPVTKIVADRADATNQTLYAATWLGVYRTVDGGLNWSPFGTGLPQVRVTDIYVHPDSAFIRVGTWGRGVWQLGTTPNYTPTTTHPYGGTFTPGTTPITMSVTARPTYPASPTYQWKRNGVNLANGGAEGISGATTATLTIATPTCSSAGTYTVTVTNCAGSVTSNNAVWSTTTAAPAITEHPANTRFKVSTANFALKVVATGASSYRWRRDGTPITAPGGFFSGYDTATLSIGPVGNGDAGSVEGNYDCVVTNAAGCTTTSNTAIVQKDGNNSNAIPNIVAGATPTTRRIVSGTGTTFSVKAGGGGSNVGIPLTFVWKRNNTTLTNGGNSTWPAAPVTVNAGAGVQADATSVLTLSNVTLPGSYTCTITSDAGSVTSAAGVLTIEPYTPADTVTLTPNRTYPPYIWNLASDLIFTATGFGSNAPPSGYQYQFWVYWDDYQGWTMVQDYGVGATYTFPSGTAPGTYGIGVNVRTNPTVEWDTFTSIDYFTIDPGGTGPIRNRTSVTNSVSAPITATPNRQTFQQFLQQRASGSR